MKNIFKYCHYFLNKEFKKEYYISLIIFFISSLLNIIGVASLLPLIAIILNPEIIFNNNFVDLKKTSFSPEQLKFIIVLSFLFLNVISIITNFFVSIYNAYVSKKIPILLRFDLYKKMYEINPEQMMIMDKQKVGNILGAEVSRLQNVITSYISLIYSSFTFILLLSFSFILDFKNTFFIILLVLCVGLILLLVRKTLLNMSQIIKNNTFLQNKMSHVFNYGFKDFIILNQFSNIFNKYKKVANKNLRLSIIESVIIVTPKIFFDFLFFIVVTGLVLFGGLSDVNNYNFNLVIVVIYIMYRCIPIVNSLYKSLTIIFSNSVSLESVKNFREKLVKNKKTKIAGKDIIKDKNKNLILSNVEYSYPNSDKKFKYNIKILNGSKTLIYGDSGVGKSTLIDILTCFIDPKKGRFSYGDYNIQNFKTSYLKKISYIPQTFMIFPETISYNIAFKEKFTQQEITNLKKIYFICGLNKIEPIFENIFKKKLLLNTPNLSGGEKQRLSFARSIYKKPEFLFIDEALNALDVNSEIEILSKTNKYLKKFTLVYISHRPIKKFFNKRILIKK